VKLSTKVTYAVRSLVDLLKNYDNKPVSIKEIAERQNISHRYLENIFTKLRQEGILESIKGNNGGFFISKNPRDISLLNIIEILDGPISVAKCVKHVEKCDMETTCFTNYMWKRVNIKIEKIFNEISLEDLLNDLEVCDR